MIIHTKRDIFSHKSSLIKCTVVIFKPFGGSRGGLRGLQPPFQISKIKESNKTEQKIEDNPLEKEEERKSCMFV